MALVFKIKFGDTLRRWVVSEDINSTPFSVVSEDINSTPFSVTLRELEAKIRELFQISHETPITITYVDMENDVITLGCDQDLVDACIVQHLNPLRLDVHVKSNSAPTNACSTMPAQTLSSTEPFLKGIFPQATADVLQNFLRSYSNAFDPLHPTDRILQGTQDAFRQFLQCLSNQQSTSDFNSSEQAPTQECNEDNHIPYTQFPTGPQCVVGHPPGTVSKFPGFRSSNPFSPSVRAGYSHPPGFASLGSRGSSHVFHRGVQCDGCGMNPIEGPRYNSTKLPDYDLCSTCYDVMGNNTDFQKIEHPRRLVSCPSPYRKGIRPHVPPQKPCATRTPSGMKTECPFSGHTVDCTVANEAQKKLDARFVKDVTIFDGTELNPGTRFTKIWRIRNTGTLPWPQGTILRHIGGDALSSSEVVNVELPDGGLPCGEDLEVSVDLVTPDNAGRYVSHWRLVSPTGQRFGHRFWVLIHVVPQGDQSPQVEQSMKLKDQAVNDEELEQYVGSDKMDLDDREKSLEFTKHSTGEGTSSKAVIAADITDIHVANEGKQPLNVEMDIELDGFSLVEKPEEHFIDNNTIDGNSVNLAEKQSVETTGTSEEMLKFLELTGFVNRELNIHLLKKNNLDLQATLDDLLHSAGWDGILKDLHEMGFDDQEMNIRLLVKNNGSIKQVVKDLVRMEKQPEGKENEM